MKKNVALLTLKSGKIQADEDSKSTTFAPTDSSTRKKPRQGQVTQKSVNKQSTPFLIQPTNTT